jgi:RNA polymerase sigma factor (sigma-70 family)
MTNARFGMLVGQLRQFLHASAAATAADAVLLQQFVDNRDEAAFAALVQRHAPLVLGVCRRLLADDHDAEDVFQATFVVLARQAASLRGGGRLPGWLHTVTCRLALRARSQASGRRARERQLSAMDYAEAPIEQVWRDLRPILDEELQAISAKYRIPLVLCHLAGKTQQEASVELGCSRDMVRRRLERGIELLRSRLTRRGLGLTAGAVAGALAAGPVAEAAPAAWVSAAVRAGLPGSASAISIRVAALAQGAMRDVWLGKLTVAAIFLAAGVVCAAAATVAQHALLAPPPSAAGEAAPRQVTVAAPEQLPTVDLYGDPLPAGATARLGTTRFRRCTALAFSPDRKILALGYGDAIGLLDVASRRHSVLIDAKQEAYPRGKFGPPTPWSMAFAPDGKTLAVRFDNDAFLRIWDVATGKEARRWQMPEYYSWIIAYTPDGRGLLTVNYDWAGNKIGTQNIHLWEVATGKSIRQFPGISEAITFAALSADGKTLATTAGNSPPSDNPSRTVRLWGVETGKELRPLTAPPPKKDNSISPSFNPVLAIGFTPDSKTVLATDRRTTYRWELATGKLIGEASRRAGEHDSGYAPGAFTPDGKALITDDHDHVARLWDVASGKELARFGESSGVGGYPILGGNPFAFSSDGMLVARRDSRWNAYVWETATGRPLHPVDVHDSPVTALAVSPDGKSVASTDGCGYRLWDITTGRHRQFIPTPRGVTAPVFTPDGRGLVKADQYEVGMRLLSDVATGKVVPAYRADAKRFSCLACSPDRRTLLAGQRDGQVSLWDAVTGKLLRQFQVCSYYMDEDGKPRVNAPSEVLCTPDGRAMIVLGNGRVTFRSMASGKEIVRCESSDQPGEDDLSLALSPDGRTLAGAGHRNTGQIRLWESATGKQRLRFAQKYAFLNCVAFSPDGTFVVTGGDDTTVRFWDPATGEELGQLTGHSKSTGIWSGGITALAFTPDGQHLISAGRDTTLLVWPRATWPERRRRPVAELSAKELEKLWAALGEPDAPSAYRAIQALASAPMAATTAIRARLQPALAPDPQRLSRLVADLDAPTFAARQQALKELEQLNNLAEAALRRVLAKQPPLELRQRAEQLLEKLDGPVTQSEQLQALRAVEVLEHIGTPEARQVLARLAEGAEGARLTRDAKAALDRLAQRHGR